MLFLWQDGYTLILYRLFYGAIATKTQCLRCHKASTQTRADPMLGITLTCPARQTPCTMQDLAQSYFSNEVVQSDGAGWEWW